MDRLQKMFPGRLQRKLLRDLTSSKGLFISVALVIFLGVAFFGASFLGYRNLKSSYDYSYETLRFADFTIQVEEAPTSTTAQLASISGIKHVTGRISRDMPLTLPGKESGSVLGRVISLPSGARPEVNDVKVEEGSYFQEGQTQAILLEKNFAKHHGVSPGDSVYLTVSDRKIGFEVAGIVTSPEYIWPAKSRQELLVSPETFGVGFVPQGIMNELIPGDPIVNEFCFRINEGTDRSAVISEAKDVLEPHGIMDVVPREEQASNAALKMDLQEFAEMSEIFPLLFLIVGALTTYTLLTRIVHNQRPQIGLMRAVGYSHRQVLIHYLSFALIIGVAGAALGMLAGYLLSAAVTNLYVDMLGLPYTVTRMGLIEWLAIEEGLFLGIIPCAIAGLIPAYRASRLSPAEAMRTPPPATGRKLLLERVFPFLIRLSFLWKIPLRNIFRSRRRSLYTIIGVAFGVSLILVSSAFIDSIDSLMSLQFNRIQRYDAQINFAQPQPATLTDEVKSWNEAKGIEPTLQVPTRLAYEDKSYSTLVRGLSPGADLYGLYSTSGGRARVGDEGILLSEGLRGTLGVDTGDTINLRSPSGQQELRVNGFVKQPMGSFGYVTLDQAQQLAGGKPIINGLMLSVGSEHLDSIREKAYQIPGVASVELTTETREMVNELMGLLRGMMWVMLAFGAVLFLAIVFTTVTVSILERRRETATMRTMGERKGRITSMITIENLILGLVGLIPGIPLGYGLALYFFSLVQTDMMSFNLVIFPRTYLLTIGLVVFIVCISLIPGIRYLNRLDLAQETKLRST